MNLSGPQLPKDEGCRRRFPRYRTDLKLTVLVLGPDGHFEINGLCNQIAEGGLGAIISSELSVGEMVNLQLLIPLELQPISLRAVVRWRKSLQHGFEFFEISSQQRTLIRDYCKDVSEQGQIS